MICLFDIAFSLTSCDTSEPSKPFVFNDSVSGFEGLYDIIILQAISGISPKDISNTSIFGSLQLVRSVFWQLTLQLEDKVIAGAVLTQDRGSQQLGS